MSNWSDFDEFGSYGQIREIKRKYDPIRVNNYKYG